MMAGKGYRDMNRCGRGEKYETSCDLCLPFQREGHLLQIDV